ncbi:NADH-quinone oxidoreductase subunit NuoK [Helicobacter sp. MIT 03-1614]|uniref:NADH-quinone oxidoreductase subunit K n=1 Tax=Helicobacter hepaticus (strain ATCC 51449 / 3B1) TaxID=235279 RepID=NUOK_HELHP|nr:MULTISPECIES: NADH-quinone oxidoreductase subunit NuoK [Helicobacter]Q7VFT2.1 RecName: Full=NADH-quinone oxidoreductase subunit K; AltName: Full=NADH dehydrogenase I subunit K; AltName: Full=NDH-1 subunit K [Helicobacter hepaticus ATCC 51449]AAP78190.1 donor-ubiquinone reductase I [Helicobacter hepaticus ATCC 51449]TLD88959.1 NADH-quinone oxidoreductase subunit NuoK [Helicobacter sp. MIT 03-1614]
MISLNHYLLLCVILFCIGLFGILRRSNILMLFFSTEILLNAINIGFVAIGSYLNDLNGEIFALFIIAIAASEIAVGLGLVVIWYKKHRTLDITTLQNLKG